jgi:hypothetical protein
MHDEGGADDRRQKVDQRWSCRSAGRHTAGAAVLPQPRCLRVGQLRDQLKYSRLTRYVHEIEQHQASGGRKISRT